DSARRPCGDKNSASSNSLANSRSSWPGRATDSSSRSWPRSPRSCGVSASFCMSLKPSCSRKPMNPLCRVIARRSMSPSMTAAARAGMIPTLDRDGLPGRGEQPVIEKPVGLIPQALNDEGLPDAREMLQELQHQTLSLALARPGEDGRDGPHRQRVGAHPARRVGLLQGVARRQVRAVDRADVVQAEETALEDVLVAGVLAVDPPGEVDQELVEDPAQEVEVAAAVDGEDLQR